jgi:hypothetical protein
LPKVPRTEAKRAYYKAYYVANREKRIAHAAAWRAANPDANRRNSLKRLYGISIETFDEMLSAQNSSCAICGTADPGGKGQFHVDHCHATGEVRALLCSQCNVGLGSFSDNPERLMQAASYLKRHKEAQQ